jgi:hypothetical protein
VPLACEDNGPAGRNEAKGQSCSWEYNLAPADTDLDNDYRVYWFQMEIDPGPGWCAKLLHFDMYVPDESRIVSAVPNESFRVSKSSIETTELIVDANGTAIVPGAIAQDVASAPGKVRVSVEDNRYSYQWRGNSRDKVVVAIGIQLSSPTLPSELITTWSEGEGAGMGSCRIVRVRVTSR